MNYRGNKEDGWYGKLGTSLGLLKLRLNSLLFHISYATLAKSLRPRSTKVFRLLHSCVDLALISSVPQFPIHKTGMMTLPYLLRGDV